MKRYKLLKDLAGLKAGSTLCLDELGNLVTEDKATIVFLVNFIHHYNILDSGWFEELPDERKQWRAKEGERYWFVQNDGEVYDDYELKVGTDDRRYRLGNYFKTEEEAQKAADWLRAFAILRDDTKGFKPDWKDEDQKKWLVTYNHDDGTVSPNYCYNTQESVLYFATRADAEESIKAHEREWRTYYGAEE